MSAPSSSCAVPRRRLRPPAPHQVPAIRLAPSLSAPPPVPLDEVLTAHVVHVSRLAGWHLAYGDRADTAVHAAVAQEAPHVVRVDRHAAEAPPSQRERQRAYSTWLCRTMANMPSIGHVNHGWRHACRVDPLHGTARTRPGPFAPKVRPCHCRPCSAAQNGSSRRRACIDRP